MTPSDDLQRLVERIERDEAKRRDRMVFNIDGRRILARKTAALALRSRITERQNDV